MILVTGATGNVGNQVARILARSGAYVRVLARNPDRAAFPSDLDVVRGDFTDPETLARASDGADALFLMLPAMDSRLENAAGRVAPNVGRVVFLSSALASIDQSGTNPIAQRHIAVENAIQAAPAWTVIRPGYFAANALRWWLPQLRTSDTLRWPFANARFAPVHERDIAEIAVLGLTTGDHAGQTYTITGPLAITAAEQLAAIGASTHRTLVYDEVDREIARETLSFLPPPVLEGILASWQRATVDPPFVTDVAARVLGKPARSFAEWATDHATAFAKSAA
ncbi:MAG TPA: NAD(P)H-binding protein [Candidatus Baltobacteraceae bacterium]|nr:NAD(P)H-binding protein [Candidatus Baltobacteraceae bacterium]